MSEWIIGIDLGTSTTEAAVMRDEKPRMIPDSKGKVVIPSAIGIDNDGKWIVGEQAKAQNVMYPERTVLEVKRKIGSGEKIKLGENEYTPVELSSKLLAHVKQYVSEEMSADVSKAVISVPAYFDDAQRRATIEAGEKAGFSVERIINEPTAAALSYGLSHSDEESHILVYDLGGGTFDVTLLEMFEGVLEVKASSGDNRLGGKDFDERIIDMLAERFNGRYGVDLKKDPYSMVKLKEEAEKCKIALSSDDKYEVSLPLITTKNQKPLSLEEIITRREFEEATADLLARTHKPIDVVLADGEVSLEEIDHIILVGGSTRMPSVSKDIKVYTNITPELAVNPDYAVSEGTAIQAGIIQGLVEEEDSIIITDVNPFTLGIKSAFEGGLNAMAVIMPRNVTIPVSKTRQFFTYFDNQTAVDVEVFQGESTVATDNHFLGSFLLRGIPPKKAGKETIEVEFSYDLNGVLNVRAFVVSTGSEASMTIDMGRDAHGTGEKAIDSKEWKEYVLSDDYKGIIRKFEKFINKSRKDFLDVNAIADYEGALFEIKRAIVEGDRDKADSYERQIESMMNINLESFLSEAAAKGGLDEEELKELFRKDDSDFADMDDLDDEDWEDEDWEDDDLED